MSPPQKTQQVVVTRGAEAAVVEVVAAAVADRLSGKRSARQPRVALDDVLVSHECPQPQEGTAGTGLPITTSAADGKQLTHASLIR